ncbi:MAG: 3-hexulose-6-phosphate synthase [Candidatus Altiarchaeota archaeon]
MKPRLQLALDFVDLDRALKVAEKAAKHVDIIEAGTPLIKAEGLDVVRALRERFPKHTIVADMKIMDAGRVEVESAAKAGADIVNVCAAASDQTIKESIDAGRHFGAEIIVDLIGVRDYVRRAEEVAKFNPDYVGVHTPIDEQMLGIDAAERVRQVAKEIQVQIAAAGGINSETVVDVVKSGASIVIVGGAITKAEDPGKAASTIRRAMLSKRGVKTALFKRSTDVRSILLKVSAANISDAMHRSGELKGIYPLSEGKMVGEAVTVRVYPGDWAKTVEAIDVAKKGDVIVIDAGGVGPAVWGELASQSAVQKKLSGVVIDGACRDTEEIQKLGLPVYARLMIPTAGEPRGLGEIDVPIMVSGVPVKPGDWIIGDSDGVVVIPKEKAVETANRAMDILEKENRIRKEIKEGSTLSKVTHLLKWEKK